MRRRRSKWERVCHIRYVPLTADREAAHFGFECAGHLAGRSAENHRSIARGYFVDCESVAPKPIHDFGDVTLGDSELRAKLARRAVMMIESGFGVLLLGDQLLTALLGRRLPLNGGSYAPSEWSHLRVGRRPK